MIQTYISLAQLVLLWIALELGPKITRFGAKLLPQGTLSHPFSQLLRPLAEARRFRLIIGTNLAAAVIAVGALGPVGGQVTLEPVEVAVLTQQTVQVLTESTFKFPVPQNTGFSQGMNRFHPGVDIRAPRGSAVYAVAGGRVVDVQLGRFGYGHMVLVEHSSGLQSLYAHLDQVNVRVGDEVTKDTVLGGVGMTGWTTGPHLHFEARSPEGRLNPRQILPET